MKKKLLKYIEFTIEKYHSLKTTNNINVDIDDSQLFFLTGYDKSGTTWMMKATNSVNTFNCKGSNQYFDHFPNKNSVSELINVLNNLNNESTIFNIQKNTFQHFFKNTYKERIKTLSSNQTTYFGEKSTIQNLNLIQTTFNDSKIIVFVRDLRDIIVSFAFHFDRRYKYRLKNWTRERSKFDEKGNIKNDFIDREIKKIKSYYEHLLQNANLDNVIFIKYEDLNSEDGINYFYKIINFISNGNAKDLEVSINKSWEDHTFEKLSQGRQKGEKDTKSFFRSGKSGDYINHLTKEQIDYINGELNTYLKYFKYNS